MSKTIFSNGSYLDSTFCNSVYNTGGGHVHDAGTSDGHAGKINLATHTTGILPWAYQSHVAVPQVQGCEISMPTTKTISVASGWISQTNGGNSFHVTGPWVKKIINAGGTDYETFTAGNGATYGGVASGITIADRQWLHVFVISDGSSYDIGCDTSIIAIHVTDPHWIYYKRIGSILIWNNGGYEVRPYSQSAGHVVWTTKPFLDDQTSLDVTGNFLLTANIPVSVPPITCQAIIHTSIITDETSCKYNLGYDVRGTNAATPTVLDDCAVVVSDSTGLIRTASYYVTARSLGTICDSTARYTVACNNTGYTAFPLFGHMVYDASFFAKSYVDPR